MFIYISTPSFSLPFSLNMFFHPFAFTLCVPFFLKLISCRQHIYGSLREALSSGVLPVMDEMSWPRHNLSGAKEAGNSL